jgi:hypothetical protein
MVESNADVESEKIMFFQNNTADQAAVGGALATWYARASAGQLAYGAWLQLHPAGTLLYNCGGVNNGGDYGIDYVDNALHQWLTHNLPAGWAFTAGPTTRWGGNIDVYGQPEFTRDYYNITRAIPRQRRVASGFRGIPAGDYSVVVNFHLYVDDWEVNPQYNVAPAGAPPLNLADLIQFPPLG